MFNFYEYGLLSHGLLTGSFYAEPASRRAAVDALQAELVDILEMPVAKAILPCLDTPADGFRAQRLLIFETLRELLQELMPLIAKRERLTIFIALPDQIAAETYMQFVLNQFNLTDLEMKCFKTYRLRFHDGTEILFDYKGGSPQGRHLDYAFVLNKRFGQ